MSQAAIRAALETALDAMALSLPTAWENVAFVPPASSMAYQRAYILFATPDNSVIANGEYIEVGIFQINLCYPLQSGDGAARARAGLIRSTFYRGATFVSGGVRVVIATTPEASQGRADGDRWVVPVKVRWFAQITA